jgi:hypothetical protein
MTGEFQKSLHAVKAETFDPLPAFKVDELRKPRKDIGG